MAISRGNSLLMKNQWAEDGSTVIPNPPVAGTTYRDESVDADNIAEGQKYDGVADSARWNQLLYIMTGILKDTLAHGVLPWLNTQDYAEGAVVMGSDGELYRATKVTGPTTSNGVDPTTDSNEDVWKRVVGDTVPLGTIVWSASKTAPEGYLLCNGATVGRSTYSALFAAIGTTYGAGDGSTTFALPNLIGRVMWGGTSPGQYLAAGLPNITGAIAYLCFSGQGQTGCFTELSAQDTTISAGGTPAKTKTVEIHASDSSSIFGNSDTVQPPALTLCPYIKAFSAATNQGMIDLTSLANDIAALDAERLKQIGQIQTFASTNLPEGWMICDGSSVLFADWPEFEQVYNEGRFTNMTLSASDPAQKGKLVLNGSSGVYLPDLEGLYKQASSADHAGGYLAAGLPNIRAAATNFLAYTSNTVSGAFHESSRVINLSANPGSDLGGFAFDFNGNAYNPIYSDSINTVQPPSVQYVRAMYLGKPNAAA